MKVLYVIPKMGVGGSETQLTELMLGISMEHEVRLFDMHGEQINELTRRISDAGIRSHFGGMPAITRHTKIRGVNLALTTRAFFRLLWLILWWRPRVVHGFLPAANLFAALAGRLLFVRLVVCSQRGLSHYADTRWSLRVADWLSFRLAHIVMANCTAIKDDLCKRYGVDSKKINIIPNGVKFS